VPGIGSQVPGTRDAAGQSGNKAECLAHASKTRTRGMQDAGCTIQDAGYRMEGRTPSTEDRARPLESARKCGNGA